ncbi:MAG TPA: hypothetical protein DCS88_11870 [Alphaproteobacteria bacterium]|nr:hypothetical protein [Alphaproteobacteria bacterium]
MKRIILITSEMLSLMTDSVTRPFAGEPPRPVIQSYVTNIATNRLQCVESLDVIGTTSASLRGRFAVNKNAYNPGTQSMFKEKNFM